MRKSGHDPFLLDSSRPSIPLKDYAYRERRYSSLAQTHPIPPALEGRRPATRRRMTTS
jgi:hypothetical protein